LSKETLKMLKKIVLCDAVIFLTAFILSILFWKEYTAAVTIGILVAVVNFLLNTVITDRAMKVNGSSFLIVLGALFRIGIAGAFALLLYGGDMLNVVAYLIGYSLHYVSIIISAALRVRQ